MKIGWVNRIEGVSLTAGSEKNSLPVENVQADPLSKKWYTAAGVKDSHFLADLASSKTARVLALLKTNLTSTTTLRVRASDSDSTAVSGDLLDTGVGSPLENGAAGVDDDYQAVYTIFSAEVTARYWRVDIEDAGLSDNIQIGRAFLGPAWSPTRSMQFGWGITWMDESIPLRADGGQDIFALRSRRRRLQFTLSFMNESEMYSNAFELARVKGISGNVLVMPAESGSFVSHQAVYGRCGIPIPLVNETYNVYCMRYDAQERL